MPQIQPLPRLDPGTTTSQAIAGVVSKGIERRRQAGLREEEREFSREMLERQIEGRKEVAGMRKGRGAGAVGGDVTLKSLKASADTLNSLEKVDNIDFLKQLNTPVVREQFTTNTGSDFSNVDFSDVAQRREKAVEIETRMKEEQLFVQAQKRAQDVMYGQIDILGNRTRTPLLPTGTERKIEAGLPLDDTEKRQIRNNYKAATAGAGTSNELLRAQEILRQMLIQRTGFDPERVYGTEKPFKILKRKGKPSVGVGEKKPKERSLRSLTEPELFTRMKQRKAAGEDIAAELAIAKERGYLR